MKQYQFIILILLAIAGGLAGGLFSARSTSSENSNPSIGSSWRLYSSQQLAISVHYPSTWAVDTSHAEQGYVTIASASPDLNNIQTIGTFGLNTHGSNPQRLDPQAWFMHVIAPNVDPPTSSAITSVHGLPAYTVVANEMQVTRHTYVFQDTRVVEMNFPADQSQFASTYSTMMDSLLLPK